MTKKRSAMDLRRRIAKVIVEEYNKLVSEEVNPHLSRLKGPQKRALAKWLMRQYFNPEKHSDKIWFKRYVTEKNVLDYVSQIKNHFPLTPAQIAGMFRNIQSLKQTLGKDKDFTDKEATETSEDEASEDEEAAKYQTGEFTFKDISGQLGGVSKTMAGKLATSGTKKLTKLTGGKDPEKLEYEEWEEIMHTIRTAQKKVAGEFAKSLIKHKDVLKFLDDMVEKTIITKSEMSLVGEKEIEALTVLAQLPEHKIVQILLQDIEEDENLIKTFQSAVSKEIFPVKRGRPRKNA